MASPFYLFRKYQKAFLVVAGVLAMFIFVVADPLMSWLQSSGGGGGPRNAKTVVATWDGGSLNLQQLEMLAQRRFKISEFLRTLVGVAAGIVEKEGGTALPPTLPDFRLQDNNPRSVQFGCIRTRILAEQAKKSGISISDDVVNHYLREWGLRRMGDVEMATILNRVGLNDKTLFAGLRELLLGNFYISSYSLATRGILPEERWQDWKRINERISVEAALLPAEKFLADVPEPSEAELKTFYELHKDRLDGGYHLVMNTRLPAPDPGFREPRRVKIQHLLGNLNDWTQKLSDTVTDAEIADYYERNKRTQFVQSSTSISAAGLFDDAEDEAEPAEPESVEAESDEPESTEETPVDEGEAATKEEPTTEETTEETSTGEEEAEPTDETPAEEAPAEETPTTEEQPAEEDSSQLTRKSPFRLAAFQEDAEAAEAAEGETASEVASDGETEESVEKTSVEKTVEDTESTEPEAEEPAQEEPVQYVPLEEVSEQIRRSLAEDKAVVELQKVVDRTYASLQSSYNPRLPSRFRAHRRKRDPPSARRTFGLQSDCNQDGPSERRDGLALAA
ncbi:MAG: hypothetical protein GXP24_10570 [Planctomycetes bacterium]|nr:hypothetical protein [Planctomycetota bacterium]